MPAPAGGFTVFFECRPAQSLMSLRPLAASTVADRSGWHSTRWSAAPGTWIAPWFAHGPVGGGFGAADAGVTHAAISKGTSGNSRSRFRADIVVP